MDEMTIEQKRALAMAAARLRVQSSAPAEAPAAQDQSMPWGDVAMKAVGNIPASGAKFASDIVQPIVHPLDTAKGLVDVAAGLVSKITPGEQTNSHEAAADAVGKFFSDRYGGIENFKKTLATDPVGFAADISTVLSGGATGAARAPGTVAAATSKTLGTAAKYADPVTLAAKGVTSGVKGAGEVASQVVGNLGTHTGADSIKEAVRSGYVGGEAGRTFRDNMRGNVPVSSILEEGKTALDKIRADRTAAYRSGMADVSKDKAILDFAPIDAAIAKVEGVKKYKGQDISASTANTREAIKGAIEDWKKLDPAEYHTPEGMDALKQKIGDIRDSTDFHTPSRVVADQAYSAIRGEITKQAPTYAKIMKDYETTSDLIREAERTLSLGKKSGADTAIRKLQSVLRSNVTANFGSRAKLARTLDESGGTNISSAAAGQSLNSLTSRGLGGMGMGATGVASMLNPSIAATLPFQSPRVVGEVAHAGGRVAGAVAEGGRRVAPMIPQRLLDAIQELVGRTPGRMGLYQAGRTSEQVDQ